MQDVMLKGPRVIGGMLRQPAEGPIPVSDDDYDALLEAGAIETDDDDDGKDDDGLEAMTIVDLNLLVVKDGVPLDGATKKADIVSAIRAHRAAKP